MVHNSPNSHQVGHTRAGQAGQREHVRFRSLLLQRFMCCRNTSTGLRLHITGFANSNNIRDLGHVLRAAFLRAGVPADLQRGRLRALQRQILRPARRRDEGDAQRLAAYLSDLVVERVKLGLEAVHVVADGDEADGVFGGRIEVAEDAEVGEPLARLEEVAGAAEEADLVGGEVAVALPSRR